MVYYWSCEKIFLCFFLLDLGFSWSNWFLWSNIWFRAHLWWMWSAHICHRCSGILCYAAAIIIIILSLFFIMLYWSLQDDYRQALIRLHQTVTRAYQVNQNIKFEVFIHKVDGLSDDRKLEAQRDIHGRATDDLADAGLEGIHLSFYLTSIYDHSIFEALSRVVQKLIPQLPTLENLLNILISVSYPISLFLSLSLNIRTW